MCRFASSICSRSCSNERCAPSSSATIFGRPRPRRTCAPAVELSRLRGNTVRSSTNWWLGIDVALRVVPSRPRATTPWTQAELPLELLEVLGRAELRVRLRDGEQAPERGREDILRLRLLLHVLGLLRGGARLRYLLEGAALVGGVALDRLDEVRDQVVAAPQLDVDLRPRVLGAVPQPDELVVHPDDDQEQQDDDRDDDDHPDHVPTL